MACQGCYEKLLKIDRLQERIEHLENKLKNRKRKEKEGYFGSSTPSAKKPFKKNSSEENWYKNGGAKPGHIGRGRKTIEKEQADTVEYLKTVATCPDCGSPLTNKGFKNRSIIDSAPVKAKKVFYRCEKKWCPKCKKIIQAKPKVLAKSLYGNRLVANACVLHFGHGVPVGRIEEILGENISLGVLFKIFQRVAKYWESACGKLIEEYRKSAVLHADETGWRTDGKSGYAWIFCTKTLTIFKFKDTRSSQVPMQVLGEKKLDGTLVVDRYGGYNKMPIKIQYCYAHLKRNVEDFGKEFDNNTEIQTFVSTFVPFLSDAMGLHSEKCSNEKYYQKAETIKQKIITAVEADAQHMGIRNFQDIFHDNEHRMYHWASDRRVPADNNLAERNLRSTVIARKVSFGSQSVAGAETRATLMTILHTARKRLNNKSLEDWFKNCLDKIAENESIDTYSLLPPIKAGSP